MICPEQFDLKYLLDTSLLNPVIQYLNLILLKHKTLNHCNGFDYDSMVRIWNVLPEL